LWIERILWHWSVGGCKAIVAHLWIQAKSSLSKPRLHPHGTKWHCTRETEPVTLVHERFSYLLLVELPVIYFHESHLLLVVPIYLLQQFIDLLVLIGARFSLFSLRIWDGHSCVADFHASLLIAISQLNQQFVLL
jgi:hypothetical protein